MFQSNRIDLYLCGTSLFKKNRPKNGVWGKLVLIRELSGRTTIEITLYEILLL